MSSQPFSVVVPVPITDAMRGPCDLVESYALWNAATNYSIGAIVTRSAQHALYKRLTNGVTATAPESDPTNWIFYGPMNYWAMFDESNTTVSSNPDNFSFWVYMPSDKVADTVMFDNVDADNIRLTVFNAADVVLYDVTISLGRRGAPDWWEYFFSPWVYARTAVFTNLPPLTGLKFAATVTKVGATPSAGTCVFGAAKSLGFAQYGATTGNVDYSKKEADDFGQVVLVKRAYSKRMNVQVELPNTKLDEVNDFLAQIRATPVVWLGAGNLYNSLVIYGFYRSFETVISYPQHSMCSLEIEGLT